MTIEQIGFVAGSFVLGILISWFILVRKQKNAQNSYDDIIAKANKESKKIIKNASFKAQNEINSAKNKIKNERKQKENELNNLEKKLMQDEIKLKNAKSDLKEQESRLSQKESDLISEKVKYDEKVIELNQIIEKEMTQLENISQFSKDDAKDWIIKQVTEEARADAAEISMNIKNEVKEKANREAKDILAKAIENMAYEYTIESTLTNIPIPNDRIKGMIIGKEGKNIKAFEEISEVKLIIDDTPETVTVSGFDPIKRDIASRTVKDLIKNKNINPREIENIWKKKKLEIEKEMRKAAADTLRDLRLKGVSDEMFEMLGRLKYRTSYGQNILQHSVEVSKLAGHMAAELGLDVELAKRAGLFHDLGKANSHDAEASHVAIGVEVATRAKEHPIVINAVLSHHEEAEPISPISVLVNAADKISGSRPGARRDSLEQYTKRIESLENIASSFDGVNKVYAMSAGREVRIIVEPKEVNDAQADMLSTNISKEIQASMEYPGTIKVTVIRRTVVSSSTNEYSKNGKKYNNR